MENLSQLDEIKQKLIQKGWLLAEKNPFKEKVSQLADLYFTLASSSNTRLGICFFEKDKKIKLRLEDVHLNDFRWFEGRYEDKLSALLDVIIAGQNEVGLQDYFGFYTDMSDVCPTFFLAWEQWEDNYR